MPAYTYEMPEKATAIAVLINVCAGLEAERVFGLIDTGSTQSCISQELADKMNLASVKTASFTGMNNEKIVASLYRINISIDNTIPFESVEVGSFIKGDRFEDVIIGMDILSKSDFAVTCKNGRMKFTIEYPPKHDFDFTKM